MPESARWKAAPSYPGYEASYSGGLVRSADRMIGRRRAGGVVLTARPDRDGYLRVTVNGRKVPVHHVVMDAWLGPCPPGMERRHGLGGNQDNSVTNLSYGTHRENERDKRIAERINGTGGTCPLPIGTSITFSNKALVTLSEALKLGIVSGSLYALRIARHRGTADFPPAVAASGPAHLYRPDDLAGWEARRYGDGWQSAVADE